MPTTWSTDALKKNRVSTLLFGGSEADRRAFAQAATQALEGAGLVEAKDAVALERSLANARAVVYVPDVTAIPPATQRAVVKALREREERPKLVLGLPTSLPPPQAGPPLVDAGHHPHRRRRRRAPGARPARGR